RSFWQLESRQTLSVTWKRLLSLRTLVSAKLVYSIGRNSSWSLWYDTWYQNTPLVEKLGVRTIYDSGLTHEATISEVLQDSNWNWPVHVWQLEEIRYECLNIPVVQRDSIGWCKAGGKFSFKMAWDSLRLSAPVVPWAKVVWYSGAIPKHSFCLWLTFNRAHLTKDKLLNLGILKQSKCSFGCGQQETLNHLFFDCPYTRTVWKKVMELNNCPTPTDWNWDSMVAWALANAVGIRFHHWMRRTGLAAAVYHCWRERNDRIFRNLASSPDQLLPRIAFDVSMKAALFLKVQDTPSNRALVENWGISDSIFTINARNG
ncbi:zf-RVT domain-containing protein, partial [Cephalotus follicularis]